MTETPETIVFLDLPTLPRAGSLLDLRARGRIRPAAPAHVPRPAPAPTEPAPPASDAATTARIERRLDDLLAVAGPSFAAFAARFDFGRRRSLADIGGTTGLLACLVSERHPQIACRSYDLEILRPIAQRRIRERGLAGRVSAEAFDFLADSFPAADIITMGVILHDWNTQRQRMLIAKAFGALPPGGVMAAIACLGDGARVPGAAGSVAIPGGAIAFGDSWDITGDAFQRWCVEAGFARCETLPLTATTGATIAYK